MFRWMVGLVLWAAAALPVQANGVVVETYSEFQRIDTAGDVAAVDQAEFPREILSPAAVRNGHLSIRVVVKAPAGEGFHVYLAQNPGDTAKVTLYREVTADGGLIRDRLERVDAPYTHVPVPGQPNVLSLLIDSYIPAKAPADRFRLEAQISHKGVWHIVPFEVRVFPVTIPSIATPPARGMSRVRRADSVAVAALRAAYCQGAGGENGAPDIDTVGGVIARNVWQDVALAKLLEPKLGRDFLLGQAAAAAGLKDGATFCASTPRPPKELGAEWYLKVRDFLIRASTPDGFEP